MGKTWGHVNKKCTIARKDGLDKPNDVSELINGDYNTVYGPRLQNRCYKISYSNRIIIYAGQQQWSVAAPLENKSLGVVQRRNFRLIRQVNQNVPGLARAQFEHHQAWKMASACEEEEHMENISTKLSLEDNWEQLIREDESYINLISASDLRKILARYSLASEGRKKDLRRRLIIHLYDDLPKRDRIMQKNSNKGDI